jgi:chemotaxis protein CheX
MKYKVALIDFPRLQEQIVTRILHDQDAQGQPMSNSEVTAQFGSMNLALYYWPDGVSDALSRLQKVQKSAEANQIPVAIIATATGTHHLELTVCPHTPLKILTTPLQPIFASRKIAELLGTKVHVPVASVNVAYINPFVSATLDTLKQMAGMDCERTGLVARTDAVSKGDISGIMGLSGPSEGFVGITFRNETARKIVCRMLDIPIGKEEDADIRDGVGEMMNIIAGRAKADLVNTEHSYTLSPPNVIVGGPHSIGQVRGQPVIVIEFKVEGEPFEVMISLAPSRREN